MAVFFCGTFGDYLKRFIYQLVDSRLSGMEAQ